MTAVRAAVVSVAVCAGGLLACSAQHDPAPGELLLAIDSNLKVPDDIDEIGVAVASADGKTITTDQLYGMAPIGAAKFPATLAIVRGTSGPIDIKVAGYKNGQAFALRETVTTIPGDRTAVLRVDLNWLDNHTATGSGATGSSVRSLTGTCAGQQTSIAGTCTSFQLDSATLTSFAAGAIVPSDDAAACLDVSECLVGGGTAGGAVTVPASSLTGGAAADGTAQCTVAPPGIGGAFNVGLVLAPGSDGWCDAASCVIPLANDAVDGWQLGSDGVVHLPASVCTNAKVVSLVFTPVSNGCPQYTPAHPACQDYGKDGGTTAPGSEAGARMDATVADSGDAAPGDAQATDGAPITDGSQVTVISDSYAIGGYGFIGFATNPSETMVMFLLRPQDGGVEQLVAYQSAADGTLVRSGPLFPTPVDPSAARIDMAAADGVFAYASGSAVQSFLAPTIFAPGTLTDAGFLGGNNTPPGTLLYLPTDAGPRLIVGSYAHPPVSGGANLAWQLPSGAFTFEPVSPGPVSALGYDPASGAYAIGERLDQTSPNVITRATAADTTPAANTPAVAQFNATAVAIAFPAPDTLVWWALDANGGPHLYSAVSSGTNAAGTSVAVTSGFLGGPRALVGGGGRIFWVGSDSHVHTMTFAAGAPSGADVDLFGKLSSVPVTQLAMTTAHLVYTDGTTFYRYPLENLP